MNSTSRDYNSKFDLPMVGVASNGAPGGFDDDGRPKRTGNFWTASAHIITAVIGSGVLSLGWAIAQLGWVAGPAVMLFFAFVTYTTSVLLAKCYRSGDPVTGKRNYTYMEAVRSNLGASKVKIFGFVQYLNLFGLTLGYTIAASASMLAIKQSICFRHSRGKNPCQFSSYPVMIIFGIIEIVFSQIPDFHQTWWLSIVASVMSFTYSIVILGLGIAKISENGKFKGSISGMTIETITKTQKLWRSFQALGDIAFAYPYSVILFEIQDTLKSPPTEAKTMKKAALFCVTVTTTFYMLCGSMGYAAFGDRTPGNPLTGLGFYNPFWILDIANSAVVVHLVGAYQLFAQPIFALVEKWAARKWPTSNFITKEIRIPFFGMKYNLSFFRLLSRSAFVGFTTIVSMLLPFFNDITGILGALLFWPLTVFLPVELYIAHEKIPKWSKSWIRLQMLSIICLVISVAAAAGSIAGVIGDLRAHPPFKNNS
ncbi:hypothetical protein Sjap_018298 [Stephania japonica]|uniref:Amino acid transporter transmembrane domain-containing protein n=1 Tax=Stephania japonica TaxID=461633 RepID=A0AAP0I7Y2_9MAGN